MAKRIGKDKGGHMKRIWTLIPVLALASACQNEQEAPESPVPSQSEETVSVFYATVESQETTDTKVYADAGLHVLWNADDRVSVFRRDTGNREYVFSGATGDNAGEFQEASTENTTPGEALPYVYAIYPYAAGTTVGTDGIIAYTFPAEQAYGENSFGQGANPMVAVTEDQFLSFKNAGTFLAVQLYGSGISVSDITIRGNKGEKLSGPATIQMAPGGDPVVSMAEGASEEVRIHCAEPVALGADAENAKIFWFVLPPTTFEKGFTVTVKDAEGNEYEKSSDKKRTLARNHLLRMKAFELVTPGFGIYPASGDPYVYDPLTDQMNIYEAEGSGWFRFLVIPELKMYELGPIPVDVASGDAFSATLTVTTAGTQDSSASYDLTVLSLQDGTLKLGTEAGDCFIIRF